MYVNVNQFTNKSVVALVAENQKQQKTQAELKLLDILKNKQNTKIINFPVGENRLNFISENKDLDILNIDEIGAFIDIVKANNYKALQIEYDKLKELNLSCDILISINQLKYFKNFATYFNMIKEINADEIYIITEYFNNFGLDLGGIKTKTVNNFVFFDNIYSKEAILRLAELYDYSVDFFETDNESFALLSKIKQNILADTDIISVENINTIDLDLDTKEIELNIEKAESKQRRKKEV